MKCKVSRKHGQQDDAFHIFVDYVDTSKGACNRVRRSLIQVIKE